KSNDIAFQKAATLCRFQFWVVYIPNTGLRRLRHDSPIFTDKLGSINCGRQPTTPCELPEYDCSTRSRARQQLLFEPPAIGLECGVNSRSRHLVRMGILHSPMTIATRNGATERWRSFLQID